MTPFVEQLKDVEYNSLFAEEINTLQVNLGRVCNQACRHCHVNAGPDRKEVMDLETVERVVKIVDRHKIPTVDLTGGAPEMNPHFRYLVKKLGALGTHVMDRCNLTVFFEPGLEDLPEFLIENNVEIIASLPCYLEENVDAIRGKGAFSKSIEALKRLNKIGYGGEKVAPSLKLVYNPSGPFLPPSQESLENDYRRELLERYGVRFNNLLTLANMPINRFGDHLASAGNFDRYMETLATSFNTGTLNGLMCRHLVSVGWDGRLYDCDFNQMLGIPLSSGCPQTVREFDPERLREREIIVGDHCYGCTAGQGSSCAGALE